MLRSRGPPEASVRLAELIPEGTDVRLVPDVERHDRYGRTLANVWRVIDDLALAERLSRR